MEIINTYLNAIKSINNKLNTEPDESVWDLPDDHKMRYAWLRNEQMYRVPWTPLKTIDGGDRTVVEGRLYQGLPYSSVKHHDKFVGHNISWETFFTAVKNPASVLYTRTCYNVTPNTNATLFYGTVCSSFTCQSLGIFDMRPVTRFMSTMDGVTLINDSLTIKMMDFLVTPEGDSGHTEVITGILRSKKTGAIIKVEITDAAPIVVRRRIFTWIEFLAHLESESMLICRYNITSEEYESLPFVQIPGEPNPKDPYIYNEVLMTDFGNKANYLKTIEPTEINIMDFINAETLIIKKDGVVVGTIQVSTITPSQIDSSYYVIYSYPNTTEGNYEAYCIMKDGSSSAKVEWIVYSYTASLASNTVANGGDITVNFAGVNCTPLSINGNYWTWSLAWGMDYNAWSSVRWLQKLTPQEVTAGQAVTNYTDTNSEGIYGVKVYFQTEFGIVPSDSMVVTFT
ncbi:hypothetical protein [Acetivibrio cellulolyticus]|uniref:hypothetical protein n=1 Tax=Acetivibrio cellulolyticus TaxID=35830 RepID=UPI0001E2C299|nr:hypothetical protein [Acetivibrio cellulolyticus]